MNLADYIAVDPKIMLGKPVIKGTRITVENILEKLANGYSHAEILRAYPHLNEDKIKAAVNYVVQSEVQSPILKKIKQTIQTIEPSARIYLYGSRARGDARPDSDWDLLILLNSNVTPEMERKITDPLYDIEVQTGQVISPLVHNMTDWTLRHSYSPLFDSINNEGILI